MTNDRTHRAALARALALALAFLAPVAAPASGASGRATQVHATTAGHRSGAVWDDDSGDGDDGDDDPQEE